MNRTPSQKNFRLAPKQGLWILLAVAACLRLYMVLLDRNILLDQGLIQDDAFYYYEIARYFLTSGVTSFDGINLTNGFHPLWQAICLPIFYFWQGDLPLRIMLGLASLLDLISIALLYRILKQLSCHVWVALAGAAIFALHGTIIRTWFNGLETALHIATLLLFLTTYLRLVALQTLSLRQHLLLGVLAAIAFLARTDSAVIIGVMLTFFYAPLLLRAEMRPPFASAGILLFILSPWLLWNLFQFGSIVQVSGQITGGVWLTGGSQSISQPFYIDILQGAWASFNPLGNVVKKLFIPFPIPDWYGYLFIVPLFFLIQICLKKDAHFALSLRQLSPFLFGVLLLFFYHAGVRAFVRSWYSTSLMLVLVILFCLLLNTLYTRYRTTALVSIATLIIAVCVFHSPYRYTRTPASLAPDPRIAAAEWMNDHTEVNALIGAANAGIVAYYSDRPVINLDGVVNQQAFRARTNNRIHHYVHESDIDYLADHKGSMAHLCAENLYYRCEEVGRWDATIVARVLPLP